MKTTISKLRVTIILASLIFSFSNRLIAQVDVYSAFYASVKILGENGQYECSQFGYDSLTIVCKDFSYERPYDDMKAVATVRFSLDKGLSMELSDVKMYYIPSDTWGAAKIGKHEKALMAELISKIEEESKYYSNTELFSMLTDGNAHFELKAEITLLNLVYEGVEVVHTCVKVRAIEIENGLIITWLLTTNGDGLLIKLEEEFGKSRGLKLDEQYCLSLNITKVCMSSYAIIASASFDEFEDQILYTLCTPPR